MNNLKKQKRISFRHDLAISFASPQRALARELANRVLARGYAVFFDEYAKGQVSGRELDAFFGDVFETGTRHSLIISSQAYKRRLWTNYEREYIIARRLTDSNHLLLVNVDGTVLPGLSKTTGHWSLDRTTPLKICDFLCERLGKSSGTLLRSPSYVGRKCLTNVDDHFTLAARDAKKKAIAVEVSLAIARVPNRYHIGVLLDQLEQEVAWRSREVETDLLDQNLAKAIGYALADRVRALRTKANEQIASLRTGKILITTLFDRLLKEV